ncbi:MAG: N-acetylmannosamine-6-phosphate 2-epimerase [Geminicoccaceae bacterium]
MPSSSFEPMKSKLQHGIVVSCQPVVGGPMDDDSMVVAMALAALDGGAKGLRIEGARRVAKVRTRTEAPLIGLVKRDLQDSMIRISPLIEDIEALADAGADVIAIDATDRPRPCDLERLVKRAKQLGRFVMADCSSLADGRSAHAMGCEIIGTTLAGYTGGAEPEDPDLDLIEAMREEGFRVMAEGRFRRPDQARMAIDRGAWCVTVGSAITRQEHITGWFVDAVEPAARPQS